MAPFLGPDKAALLKLLRGSKPESKLPLTLGQYTPAATVECVDGIWQIRRLVEDRAASARAGQDALARGESWMPEHTWAYLGPGAVVVSAPTLREFIAAIEALRWEWSA